MPLKLYQRRGALLQGKSIEMPTPEKKANNLWGEIFDNVSKTTAKLSAENYALGKAKLINDVLNTAYEQAPDNPKQFNDLIKSGFEKGLVGFDDKLKNDIYAAANDKVKMLQVKVGNNLNKRLDAENTQRIVNLANDAIYGSSGIIATNQMIADAIQYKEDPQKVQNLIDQRNKTIARLQSFANAKNMKGGYVIGSAKMRAAMVNPSTGMYDTILNSFEDMDIEALKEYDNYTFNKKDEFMKATGFSESEYSKMDKAIKKRRKLLDENDKREINRQNWYDSINYIYTRNPETLENIKSTIGDDNYKALQDLADFEDKHPINPALIMDKDVNMIKQFNKITKVLGSKNDGTEEYNDNLLKATIEAGKALSDFTSKYGAPEDSIQTMRKILVSAASNEQFAGALNMLNEENTALGQEIRNFAKETLFETDLKKGGLLINKDIKNQDKPDIALRKMSLTNRQKTGAKIASDAIAEIAKVASQAYNTNDPEQIKIIMDNARKVRDYANKEIIKNNVSAVIPPEEMNRLERELSEGKRAFFEYNGNVYEFFGFGKNGIFYK